MPHVLVWDIETVPDLAGFAAANGHEGKTEDEIRAELGEKFPKHIYHSIVCIGALIAHQQDDRWVVDALGAPHVGDRSDAALASFLIRAGCICCLLRCVLGVRKYIGLIFSATFQSLWLERVILKCRIRPIPR